ncbi:hypothetical protein DYB37_004798 [Aphanomyces astaci]|uniref:Uncharacterized protein n=1 Tax=Aphanomyces astaci TaxID=112090 RepID=A0A3R7C4S3_APHAT|nr:hypothetical protein DYB37_004798 [Aphanomyces astaci]
MDEQECTRAAVLLSVSFLLIFTSYNGIEVSVVYATIKHEPAVSSMGKFNGLFFAIYKSSRVTGNLISSVVLDYLAWSTTTLFMVFTCIGLYGTALLCSLPTVGAAPSRSTTLAKGRVALLTSHAKECLQTSLLLSISFLLLFTSYMAIEASYLTRLSVIYAQYMNVPAVSSMGTFNGSFYAFYKMSRITGNLLSSFVLGFLGWYILNLPKAMVGVLQRLLHGHRSTASLFAVYTGISVAGSVLMATLPDLVHPAGDESTALLKAAELPIESSSAATTLRALWDIAKDRRMVVLIPVWLLSGLQLGFVSGEFTVHFIRQSLGSASIGYVMATFGVVNVVCSFWFGKLADKYVIIGLFFAQMVGFGSLFVAYALCMWSDVVKCDGQWTLVLGIAVLLSVAHVCSLEGRLWVLMLNVVLATASFAVYSIRHRQIAGVPPLGGVVMGTMYLTFMTSAMAGPFLPPVLGGVAASFLWISQASYLTRLSVLYSQFKRVPAIASVGLFNGIFLSLFWIYTATSVAGTALLCLIPDLPLQAAAPLPTEYTKLLEPDSAVATMRSLAALAMDRRMLALTPIMLLNGLQQGFLSGEFTSNVVRESLGSAAIGTVFAVVGLVSVSSSFVFGKLADKYNLLMEITWVDDFMTDLAPCPGNS